MKKIFMLLILALVLTICSPICFAAPATPEINFDSSATRGPVSVTVTAALNEGELIYYSLGSDYIVYTEAVEVSENCSFSAKVVGSDSSESSVASVSINCIDNVAPAAPEIESLTQGWTNTHVEVQLVSPSDVDFSHMEYSLDNGEWVQYTDSFTVSQNALVKARSLDVLGNESQPTQYQIENIDKRAPSVTAVSITLDSSKKNEAGSGIYRWYFGSWVSCAASGFTDLESGVAQIQYCFIDINASVTESGWKNYNPSALPVITREFTGYVYFRAVDIAGNISSAVCSDSFFVDFTPPTISNIKYSTKSLTDSYVTVSFDAADNAWLDSVSVDGVEISSYSPSFNAYRNGKFTIIASDMVGNKTQTVIEITNINSTPFTLLDMVSMLDEDDYTPTSWKTLQTACDEMKSLLDSEATDKKVLEASDKLLAALEALVNRGDNVTLEKLVEKADDIESAYYTESSYASLALTLDAARELLTNEDAAQSEIDSACRSLENAIESVVKLADFTALDRLIAQCDNINGEKYDSELYTVFASILNDAKELSRTDSSQADADACYNSLLLAMKGLSSNDNFKDISIPAVILAAVLLLILLVGILLIYTLKKGSLKDNRSIDNIEAPEDLNELVNHTNDVDPDSESIGDIYFDNDERDDN